MDRSDLRRTDESAERCPVPRGLIFRDRTHLQIAKGRLTEGLQRIERGNGGVIILQHKVVGRKGEAGVDGAVGGGDFDGLRAGKTSLVCTTKVSLPLSGMSFFVPRVTGIEPSCCAGVASNESSFRPGRAASVETLIFMVRPSLSLAVASAPFSGETPAPE